MMSDVVSMPAREFARQALAKVAESEGETVEDRLAVLASVVVDILKRIEDDASQDVDLAF